MKEYIIANSSREDVAVLTDKCSIDIDVGKDNDFQLIIPLSEYNPDIHKAGNILYCLGTEYGGILHNPQVDTKSNTITFTGDTPRGMLAKKIIQPESGKDYATTGTTPIGTIIPGLLLQEQYGYDGLLVAPLVTQIPIVYNCNYDRYCSILSGVSKVFESYGYKIQIKAEYDSDNKVVWKICTVPIVDYAEQIEISQDANVNFVIKQQTYKYTHMICAGKGELKDRLIVHLYLQEDGTIGTTKYYTGIDEQMYFYDYSSAESESDLISSGKLKFKEINASDTQKMTIDNFNVEVGDIVGGREYHTRMTIREKVTQKIYKYNYGVESIEYKIGSD